MTGQMLLRVMVEGDVVAEVLDTKEIAHDRLRDEVEEVLETVLAKARDGLQKAKARKAAEAAEQAAKTKANLDRLWRTLRPAVARGWQSPCRGAVAALRAS